MCSVGCSSWAVNGVWLRFSTIWVKADDYHQCSRAVMEVKLSYKMFIYLMDVHLRLRLTVCLGSHTGDILVKLIESEKDYCTLNANPAHSCVCVWQTDMYAYSMLPPCTHTLYETPHHFCPRVDFCNDWDSRKSLSAYSIPTHTQTHTLKHITVWGWFSCLTGLHILVIAAGCFQQTELSCEL